MKHLRFLTTFSPWILCGLISAFFPSFSILSPLLFILLTFSKLRRGFLLEWSSLFFFLAKFFNDHIFKNSWIDENLSILSPLFFVLVTIVSLLARQPFTQQYARLEAEEKLWNHPRFIRVNTIMTSGFGAIFLAVTLANLYRHFHPGVIQAWMVWGPAFAMKILLVKAFPPWYKKRVQAAKVKLEANS
jgi:hypothetical protein